LLFLALSFSSLLFVLLFSLLTLDFLLSLTQWHIKGQSYMNLPLKVEAMLDIIPTFRYKIQYAALRGVIQHIYETPEGVVLVVGNVLDLNNKVFAQRFRAICIDEAGLSVIRDKELLLDGTPREFQCEVATPYYSVQRILSIGSLRDATVKNYRAAEKKADFSCFGAEKAVLEQK
jgi:hypothetical protein